MNECYTTAHITLSFFSLFERIFEQVDNTCLYPDPYIAYILDWECRAYPNITQDTHLYLMPYFIHFFTEVCRYIVTE